MTFSLKQRYWQITQQLLARDEAYSSMFTHGTLLGDQSESIVRDFMRAVFPQNIRVETGQIVLPNGEVSGQTDVVIFEDQTGAVVGASETGALLIHGEAAKAVIEVKRSIQRDTIKDIQSYAKELHSTFERGQRATPWYQWAFVFRSEAKTASQVCAALTKAYHEKHSVGLMVVLDAKPTAADLKASFHDCVNSLSKRKQPTGAALEEFVRSARTPNSALFGRDQNQKKYVMSDKKEPPLLEFVRHLLEQVDMTFEKSPLSFRSFQ